MNFEKIKDFFQFLSLEKMKEFFGKLNIETLKSFWKEEWTPIALAAGGVVLLLLVILLVVKIAKRRRLRQARQFRANGGRNFGYDSGSMQLRPAVLTFQFFLNNDTRSSFFDRD